MTQYKIKSLIKESFSWNDKTYDWKTKMTLQGQLVNVLASITTKPFLTDVCLALIFIIPACLYSLAEHILL